MAGAAEGPAATLFHGALVSPRCQDVPNPPAGPVAVQCVVPLPSRLLRSSPRGSFCLPT